MGAARGQDITGAVFVAMDELKAAFSAIYPIEDAPDVPTDKVSVAGAIDTLWEPSSPKIEQLVSSLMIPSESTSLAG